MHLGSACCCLPEQGTLCHVNTPDRPHAIAQLSAAQGNHLSSISVLPPCSNICSAGLPPGLKRSLKRWQRPRIVLRRLSIWRNSAGRGLYAQIIFPVACHEACTDVCGAASDRLAHILQHRLTSCVQPALQGRPLTCLTLQQHISIVAQLIQEGLSVCHNLPTCSVPCRLSLRPCCLCLR